MSRPSHVSTILFCAVLMLGACRDVVVDPPPGERPIAPQHSSTPSTVTGPWAIVSGGLNHTCALTKTGHAYCWGIGREGQLGHGEYVENSTVPVAVQTDLIFTSITNWGSHTCALTTAGKAYCWGRNTAGEFGNGTNTGSATPVPAAGNLTFAKIGAGGSGTTGTFGGGFTCGVTLGGQAYCWGGNGRGQLGIGSTVDTNVPVPVHGGHTFRDLSVGHSNVCGVTTGDAAYCWGRGLEGQIGNGTVTDHWLPAAVSGGHVFESISTGSGTVCALKSGGEAWCWGWGPNGELGDGNRTSSNVPVAVAGGHSFVTISATNHVCGLLPDHQTYCWGRSSNGGGSTLSHTGMPQPIRNDPIFAMVSPGAGYSCGVTALGAAYCWGGGYNGVLGIGVAGAEWPDPKLVAAVTPPASSQTISFSDEPPTDAVVGGSWTLTATGGGSGNPVTFSSLTADVCTVFDDTVTFVATGECTIAANQAGVEGVWLPAEPVTLTLVVGRAPQVITFDPLSDVPQGTEPFALSASGGASGNPVVFSSVTPSVCHATAALLSLTHAAGTCTVHASQSGDDNYLDAAVVVRSFEALNVPPVVGAIPGGTVALGEPYIASGSFGDPGADEWSATVDYGDGAGPQPLTLSGFDFELHHTYTAAGEYVVTVTVFDGMDAGSGSATVTVEAAAVPTITSLLQTINALHSEGALSNGEVNSLRATLNAAERQLERGNATTAANQLRAFINQIRALQQSGRLAAETAASLIADAQAVIGGLSG